MITAKENLMFEVPYFENDYITQKNDLFAFTDDEWNLFNLINNNRAGIAKFHYILHFSRIKEDKIKTIIKQYTWLLLAKGKLTPKSIGLYINNHFIGNIYKFLNNYNIKSFEEIDSKLVLKVAEELNSISKSGSYKATILKVFIDICNTSIKREWKYSPKNFIQLETTPFKYYNVSYEREEQNDNSIPDIIFNKMIRCAEKESPYQINYQNNLPMKSLKEPCRGIKMINREKFGILIQAFTGLRISEVLTLKYDCLLKKKNTYWLKYTSSKVYKEPIEKKIIIHEKTFNVISQLIELSQPYRDILRNYNDDYSSSIKNMIFLISSHSKERPVSVAKSSQWSTENLKRFIERNNITYIDKEGKEILYQLRSHQFRHNFAKRLVNDGVPLRIIKRHYSHISIDMTIHYATVMQEKLEKDYIETYVKSKSFYYSGNIGKDFEDAINNIKIGKSIDEIHNSLSKRFGINPLPMGLCLLDYKKGHCTHTGSEGCYFSKCNDFITNSSFLPIFERHQEILKKEINRTKDNKFAQMTYKLNLTKKEKIDTIIKKLNETGIYKEEEYNDE
jgi:integrase